MDSVLVTDGTRQAILDSHGPAAHNAPFRYLISHNSTHSPLSHLSRKSLLYAHFLV